MHYQQYTGRGLGVNMVLKYYYDLMSQPSRAVYIFLKLNNIEFEPKPVALRKRENQTEEYKKLNPFCLVPVLDDGGFVLTESVAILKYLITKYNLADHWYPRNDLQATARVEEYLNWHHSNTRMHAALLFLHLLIIPSRTQKPIDFTAVEEEKKRLAVTIKHLENYFLRDNLYLCGRDISIADILGICELMQLYSVSEDDIWASNKNVKAWADRVKERLQPHFDEGHKITYWARDSYKNLKTKLAKL